MATTQGKYKFTNHHWRWSHLSLQKTLDGIVRLAENKNTTKDQLSRGLKFLIDEIQVHTIVEDQFYFPDLYSKLPEEEREKVKQLQGYHEHEEEIFQKLKTAIENFQENDDQSRETVKKVLQEERAAFLAHNKQEEEVLIPLVTTHISEESQREVGLKIGAFMRPHPAGKLGLYQFREVVRERPEEQKNWETLPWVLRSVVVPGFWYADSSIKEYFTLFFPDDPQYK
eukprot:TRINITY_DN2916_c0_g2_i1.p1 TRINITY_DN2916_c0_g2~~TRINITY_DN2916_c0_g2_i1.p1  ORF type:complete len:227 (-),score=60.80 TRINITY_DN2916_c0_g2_i1:129-809(-)